MQRLPERVFAPNQLMIGILPNVNSINLSRDANFGDKCSFAHRQVEGQPSKKKRKRMVIKVQWLLRKLHDNWVAFLRTQSRRNLSRFYGRSTRVLGPIRRVQFTKATQRHANIREKRRSVARKFSSQSSSSAQSVRFEI